MIDKTYSDVLSKVESYSQERPVARDQRQVSYSDWAIDEIISRLLEEVDRNPYCLDGDGPIPAKDVIEYFYLEMEYLEDTSDTPRQRLIFNIAKREADAILAIL